MIVMNPQAPAGVSIRTARDAEQPLAWKGSQPCRTRDVHLAFFTRACNARFVGLPGVFRGQLLPRWLLVAGDEVWGAGYSHSVSQQAQPVVSGHRATPRPVTTWILLLTWRRARPRRTPDLYSDPLFVFCFCPGKF